LTKMSSPSMQVREVSECEYAHECEYEGR
jgi:hypothetical protein